MSLAIIAAVAKNNVIGKSNSLPWYLPEDLKRFKQLTTGKTVLMGRKTFESVINKLGKPLPNRKNVVITSQADYSVPEGVIVYNDLNKALNELKNDEVLISGGAKIYEQTIGLVNKLYITHINREVDGDVLFPKIDLNKWKKISEEKHDGFSFVEYERI